MMKFNFKIQPFQTEAVDNVIRVFNGQPKQDSTSYRRDVGKYSNTVVPQATLFDEDLYDEHDTGWRNAPIVLDDAQILKNIREIQQENNIKLSPKLVKELGAVSLDVEMETGTGKTYVYIKTMFELHKRYGWSKYIVVVPSIAIREGVKKSFEMTQEHFMELYGIKARFFIYNSSNLHQLDEFSSGSGINVMIINIQAFAKSLKKDGKSKESLIIYSKRDEFGSRRPIDVIKANHPIVILDEPQKMGGTATQNALKNNFAPLFSLNYSATHKTTHNLVYVLDALDAYTKKLVKKIEVKGFDVKNQRGADKYLYLAEIVISTKIPKARLEFEVARKTGTKRDTQYVQVGDSIYEASQKMEQYKGLSVTDINPFNKSITFTDGTVLYAGDAVGDVNEDDMRRIQIRETVYSHLDKEESLFSQGIKCLSLFFIDEVAKYRLYDNNGEELLGEYGKIFEEEYLDALNKKLTMFPSDYQEYLRNIDVEATHKGYFSIDKQGRAINSTAKRGSEFSDDVTAYDLILRRKEQLLSFEEPTRFIFSHSALREGWDNPNVFQICTLKRSDSATGKRQEVGRGLRLCVNKIGDRQDYEVCGDELVHEINKLTVIASESYAGFVSDLQSKIREDLYERPTKASVEYFTGKLIFVDDEAVQITERQARIIYQYLSKNEYIDFDDNITSAYHEAADAGNLAGLPYEVAPFTAGIHKLVQGIFDLSVFESMIGDANGTKVEDNPLNDNFYKKEFQELWKAINKRYAYTVDFDSPKLIEKCIEAINRNLIVAKLKYTMTVGLQHGTDFNVTRTQSKGLEYLTSNTIKYDLIGKVAENTTMTRKSVSLILSGISSDKRSEINTNPEEFILRVSEEINRQKAAVVVEQITYCPSAEEPYSQEIFNMSKTSREYEKAFQARRAIQDYVFVDGIVEDCTERKFVRELDVADEVVVYAKLPSGPRGFYIPTPVGNYSPDWAIAFHKGEVKHIFFIAETKGTMDTLQLKPIEQKKIVCAKKLFNEISTTGVKYHDVDSYERLLDVMQTL